LLANGPFGEYRGGKKEVANQRTLPWLWGEGRKRPFWEIILGPVGGKMGRALSKGLGRGEGRCHANRIAKGGGKIWLLKSLGKMFSRPKGKWEKRDRKEEGGAGVLLACERGGGKKCAIPQGKVAHPNRQGFSSSKKSRAKTQLREVERKKGAGGGATRPEFEYWNNGRWEKVLGSGNR